MSLPLKATVPPLPKFDQKTARRFLSALMDPAAGVTELRVFRAQFGGKSGFIVPNERYSSTLAGWYDNVDDLIVDLGKLNGVSGYITINPVNEALLGRCCNKITKQAHTTTDADIVCYRWLYIDIDPKRPADISATDEELTAALEVRDRILADHIAIASSSMWGRSGNGGWILVLLPDYFVDEGYELAAQALDWLSMTYSTGTVKIDVSTKSRSRVGVIPGTVKCKGSNITARPYRLATLDSPDRESDDPLLPCDLKAWVANLTRSESGTVAPTSLPKSPKAGGRRTGNHETNGLANGHIPPSSPSRITPISTDCIVRATAYLARMAPAISGQGGHNQTYDAACALIKGFDLSVAEARPILHAWNLLCQPPWSAAEIEHKLESADEAADDKTRGYIYDRETPLPRPWEDNGHANGETNGEANGHTNGTTNRRGNDETSSYSVPEGMEEDTHRLARLLIDQHSHSDGSRLYYWREEFWSWTGTHYDLIPKKELRGEVTRAIYQDFIKIYAVELMRFNTRKAAAKGDDDAPKPKKPTLRNVTTRLVSDVLQALESIALVRIDRIFGQPAWLDDGRDWNPVEILPAKNALIHLPSFVADLPCAIDPTPKFFNSYALSYDIGSMTKVGKPAEWLKFLAEIWPKSQDSIDCLQEWFGYLLTPDTRYQKILLAIGPPRSGKGTIFRVLEQLVGSANVAHPILGQLAGDFGLEPLLGKPIAIVGDARIGGRADKAVIVERLLSISGEDPQTIARKHRSSVTMKLPTRFVIVSNELPSLRDSSGALLSRLVILQFILSFKGKEDMKLIEKLIPELPGILLWAVDGWKRLRDRGRFVQPKMAGDLIEEMETISSPIMTFLREQCILDSESNPPPFVVIDDLYGLWKTWCQERELATTNKIHFARALLSAAPAIHKVRKGKNGHRFHVYEGIRVRNLADGPEVIAGDPETDSNQSNSEAPF